MYESWYSWSDKEVVRERGVGKTGKNLASKGKEESKGKIKIQIKENEANKAKTC
jgi:hypothetical protein